MSVYIYNRFHIVFVFFFLFTGKTRNQLIVHICKPRAGLLILLIMILLARFSAINVFSNNNNVSQDEHKMFMNRVSDIFSFTLASDFMGMLYLDFYCAISI